MFCGPGLILDAVVVHKNWQWSVISIDNPDWVSWALQATTPKAPDVRVYLWLEAPWTTASSRFEDMHTNCWPVISKLCLAQPSTLDRGQLRAAIVEDVPGVPPPRSWVERLFAWLDITTPSPRTETIAEHAWSVRFLRSDPYCETEGRWVFEREYENVVQQYVDGKGGGEPEECDWRLLPTWDEWCLREWNRRWRDVYQAAEEYWTRRYAVVHEARAAQSMATKNRSNSTCHRYRRIAQRLCEGSVLQQMPPAANGSQER